MQQIKMPGVGGITKYIPYTISALLILVVSAALWYFPGEYAYRQQPPRDQNLNPEGGVWDFTGYDLESEIVFIEGAVEYVLGEHLAPEEFDAWKGEIHYGKPPEGAKALTARLVLVFPEDRIYTLAVTTADYSERTYVNGELRYTAGSPGLTAGETTAGKVFTALDVMPEGGVVTIVRQGANFVHKEGDDYVGYYIGSPENIRQMVAITQMFPAISIGLYLCLFLLHMILYLLVRGFRPNLWFALLCFLWLFRTGFMGRTIYYSMFPGIPWMPVYRLGCVSLALTGILLLLLINDQFPGAVQKWPLRLLLLVQAVFVSIYLIADTVTTSHVKAASEILLFVVAVYIAVRFIMILPGQARQRALTQEQCITLAGLAVALFALLHDAIRHNNIAPGIFYYEIADVGILVLALFQATAMIMGTMRQLAEARQDAQIAWKAAEVARKGRRIALIRAESAEKDLELQKQIAAAIPAENLIICGPLTLDTANRQAFLKDIDMELKDKEFGLLAYFIKHENETVSPGEIYTAVWKQPYVPTDRGFSSNLYRLRKKILGSGYVISNVRGKGYCFEKE
ncbi:MAG: winged helix-turn-helix domain-containing protein [Clostridiales bacterium]|nr:winged helix-turn-helix domain-containing protein [Clostridiales bacterium]